MNRLCNAKRAQILHLLCEGQSLRAVTRLTGCSKNTVAKLLVEAGHACAAYQDKAIRNLNIACRKIVTKVAWHLRNPPEAPALPMCNLSVDEIGR